MANQLANQLIRRLAQSSAVSLRCGCSTAAGPSVIRQAHSARRALHVLGRTQQETTQMQRPSTKERSTERVSGYAYRLPFGAVSPGRIAYNLLIVSVTAGPLIQNLQ